LQAQTHCKIATVRFKKTVATNKGAAQYLNTLNTGPRTYTSNAVTGEPYVTIRGDFDAEGNLTTNTDFTPYQAWQRFWKLFFEYKRRAGEATLYIRAYPKINCWKEAGLDTFEVRYVVRARLLFSTAPVTQG